MKNKGFLDIGKGNYLAINKILAVIDFEKQNLKSFTIKDFEILDLTTADGVKSGILTDSNILVLVSITAETVIARV